MIHKAYFVDVGDTRGMRWIIDSSLSKVDELMHVSYRLRRVYFFGTSTQSHPRRSPSLKPVARSFG